MDKKFVIFIILAILAMGGIVSYGMSRSPATGNSAGSVVSNIPKNEEDDEIEKTENKAVPSETSQNTKQSVFTLSEVAAKNTPSACFTAISGSVYDLTSWIARHPGGDKAIISICGKDGTEAFNGQHGGRQKPEQVLAGFKIGTLKI